MNWKQIANYAVLALLLSALGFAFWYVQKKRASNAALQSQLANPIASASTDMLFQENATGNSLFGSELVQQMGNTASVQSYNAAQNFGITPDLGGSSSLAAPATLASSAPNASSTGAINQPNAVPEVLSAAPTAQTSAETNSPLIFM